MSDWQCYRLDNVSQFRRGGGGSTCIPSPVERTRRGITYEFERFGRSNEVCMDSRDRKYDYGEFELGNNDDADECATECVSNPDEDTLEHLVGFDWNCDESLCRWQVHCAYLKAFSTRFIGIQSNVLFLSLALTFSLYENDQLSDSDEATFDDFDSGNNGVGSIDQTDDKDDWRCYKLESTTQEITTQEIIASIA